MGSIGSNRKAIDSLLFSKMKANKVYKNCEIIRVDNTFFIKSGYEFFTDENRSFQNFHYCLGNWSWMPRLLKAMVKLGVITNEDMDLHIKDVEDREVKKKLKYKSDDFLSACKALGITPTKAQLKKVVYEPK